MFLHEELSVACAENRESLLSKSLRTLDEKERAAIFLRFWNPCTIQDISNALKMSWGETDRLIESTMEKLKQKIMEFEKGDVNL